VRNSPSARTMYFLVLLGIAGGAAAQVERSGGGESQRIMQQYQQLAAERTTLQADNARLKKDLDAAKADLAAMKKERDAAKAQIGAAQTAVSQAKSSKEGVDKSLEVTKQRFTELIGKYRELAQNMKDVETERGQLHTQLAASNRAFDGCAEDNLQLFEINSEVLDRYEHTGLFTRVSASEPFTRVTRTRMENLVVEYRERAEQLRVKKRDAEAEAAVKKDGPAPK
jgi:chromosome segregation ATPase